MRPPKPRPGLTLVLTLLLASWAVHPRATADVLRLKHGGVIEGTIEERGDTLHVVTRFGSVDVKRSEVASIERRPTPAQLYAKRAAELDADPELAADPDARLALALFARQQRYEPGAREQLKAVLAIDPEHETARLALGHEKRDGQWVSAEVIQRERAAVIRANREQDRKTRAARAEARRTERKLEGWFRDLAVGSRKKCDAAYESLVRWSEEHDQPALAKQARHARDTYEAHWRRMRARNRAMLEVDATVSQVRRPVRSIGTPLGGGSGSVGVALPEARVTSVRTTVWIPAGRGLTAPPTSPTTGSKAPKPSSVPRR